MTTSAKPSLLIVTPYLAGANNGNWRTALRWSRLLQSRYRVIVQADARGADAGRAACLIALHARRSHPSIIEWQVTKPRKPLVVALTGTDLYRDLPSGDNDARDSVERADALIVLQDDALKHVAVEHRRKTHVVLQSAPLLKTAMKPAGRLNCVMVGHLREEKDPLTAFAAWRALPENEPIYLRHVGAALDQALGDAATALRNDDERYQWLGPLPHAQTRQVIKRAHLLILPSLMEGGANVVVEALTSGTAVLGSRMSGNIGMLGVDYPGLFPVGDSAALAALLVRCRNDRRFLQSITSWCSRRAPLFSPARERRALFHILSKLM